MGNFQQICRRTLITAILAGVAGIAGAADDAQQSLVEWNFQNGDDGGWRNGWSKTPETSIDSEFDVVNGLGLRMTFDFHGTEWGDSNITAPWSVDQAPAAVSVRILAPVSGGKPKGPMQLGCAMNIPTWVETKAWWSDMKFPETVTINGVEYRAQTVTCDLGTSLSAQVPKQMVLRFGGYAVNYKGVLYIQQIRALRIPGAPPVSVPAALAPPGKNTPVAAPVRTAPVVAAPVRTAPVVAAPAPAPAPVVAAPSKKSHSKTLHHYAAPVVAAPVVAAPVVAAPVVVAPVSEPVAPVSKPKPVYVEPVRTEPVRAQRNVD